LQSRFSKYFPGIVKDKYNWIRDPFHAVLPPNSNFCLQKGENYINMISRTSLKIQHQSKSLTVFWVGVGREYPWLSRKALKILLPFTTSYLYETGFSAVAAIKMKYRSVMNLENNLRVAI
jgi:hypothetical protein